MELTPKEKELDRLISRKMNLTLRELRNAYRLSLKNTRMEISELYLKYGNDEGILEYNAMLKFNRLKSLEKDIADELQNLYAQSGKDIRNIVADSYETAYYHTGYQLETGTQVKLRYTQLPTRQIQVQVQNPISGLTLNETLTKNRNQIIIETKRILTQGMIQGRKLPEVAKQLAKVYEGDYNKAIRVVRTETNRARNAGTNDSFNHAQNIGLDIKKTWVATLDDRTRDSHQVLDGQIADSEGYFEFAGSRTQHPGGFGVSNLDINCRCTIISRVAEPTVRRARDSEGKGVVIPYQTYKEWKENRVF